MKYTRDYILDIFWYFLLGGIVIIIDQWTKHWAFQTDNTSYSSICIELIPVINKGLAFSILASNRVYLHALLGFIVFLFICLFSSYTYWRYRMGYKIFAESIVLASSISNLLDRMLYGGVLDFISISLIPGLSLPVGNIADCFIVGGLLYMVYEIVTTAHQEPKIYE